MSIRCCGAALTHSPQGPQPAVAESWACRAGSCELSIGVSGADRLFVWQRLALLVRGVAVRGEDPWNPDHLAEEVRAHYVERGTLPPDLEGGFTLILLDADTRRVLLHRNVGGVAPTWYHAGPDGLRFAGNLTELVEAVGEVPRPAPGVLAEYVRSGQLPLGATLFDGFGRLLPGETLTWDPAGLSRFAVCSSRVVEVADGRDAVLARVLTDHVARSPGAVTLLSGGAGSRRLQALWNGLTPWAGLPSSFSVALDAAHAWGETVEAIQAAHDLGSRHTLVLAEAFGDALRSAVAASGEPPPDELTPHFPRLGAALTRQGVTAVLSGDGSEALLAPARVGLLRRLGLLAPAAADLTAALERAALRSVLLQEAGVELLCPYLDSRVLRLAVAPTTPQAGRLPPAAWLAPGGCLRSFVDTLDKYSDIDPAPLSPAALYRLVCCDLWRKHFIAGAMPRPTDSPSSTGIPVRAA